MLDFRRITLFCLEKRLSKHKMAIFSKNFGGNGPLWLRLCLNSLDIRNKNSDDDTNEKATVELYDHTPIKYLF